ncbi:rhomboid family intramembrane serine protease [Microbacterium sp. ZW T5_56]|uniref:rhomboid family intramembrane serine protease n=1 Tax=Microbacterium sp. ZW T5_56 TaxID=3378081 RepID=UPI0038547DE2
MSELAPARRSPIRGRIATAAITSAGFVALLWAIEIVDTVMGNRLDYSGIQPREIDGLWGILWAPLLHGGWQHLLANSGPALVLIFVITLSGLALWAEATAIIWVVAGVGTWLIAQPNSVHIGASSLIFGWITFLVLRGIFARSALQIVVGVLALGAYGSVLWGVFPGQQGISWQGHLFGAIGGVVAAVLLGRRARENNATPTAG